MPADYVIVHLTGETPNEEQNGNVTPRQIKLDKENDSFVLGRASSKGVDILAQPDNGYFTNAVVSRNHAVVQADLFYERLYIKDVGSTHGTFVNNIRIPATVRHPVRTGDLVTLGIEIKNHGSTVARPSKINVAVQFGMNKPPVEQANNVFQVPDETSVEGSEPEDTLERARRFLHEHTGRQEIRDAIDLTEDTVLPMAMRAECVPGPAKDDDEEESLEPSLESDLSGSDSDEDSGDDVQELCELEDELEYDLSPEPSCSGVLDEIEADTLMEIEVEAAVESNQATSPRVAEEAKDKIEPSQPADDISPSLEVEDVTIVESESHPRLSEVGDHVLPATNDISNLSKKRKACDISVDESEIQNEIPAVNVLSAAGVQTDPSDVREPKRLRRAADIVGYTALGGLAGALAVFATLVVSAPSFS